MYVMQLEEHSGKIASGVNRHKVEGLHQWSHNKDRSFRQAVLTLMWTIIAGRSKGARVKHQAVSCPEAVVEASSDAVGVIDDISAVSILIYVRAYRLNSPACKHNHP